MLFSVVSMLRHLLGGRPSQVKHFRARTLDITSPINEPTDVDGQKGGRFPAAHRMSAQRAPRRLPAVGGTPPGPVRLFQESDQQTGMVADEITLQKVSISRIKQEPDWMRELRLKAYDSFVKQKNPDWGPDLSGIDFDEYTYYIKPSEKQGKDWDEVPETIKVVIDGELPSNVMSKDVILRLIGDLGADGATYRALEFTGSAVKSMSIASRTTMANMAIEAGAKCALFTPDEKTEEYCEIQLDDFQKSLAGDPDAVYLKELHYKAEDFVPVMACPSQVDKIRDTAFSREPRSIRSSSVPVRTAVSRICRRQPRF